MRHEGKKPCFWAFFKAKMALNREFFFTFVR